MGVIHTTVNIQLPGMDKLTAAFARKGGIAGQPQKMFLQWGARYGTFVRRRFDRASKRDGTWKDLSPETIEGRRTGGKYRKYKTPGSNKTPRRWEAKNEILRRLEHTSDPKKRAVLRADHAYLDSHAGVSILRDTGTLFNALSIGAYGNVNKAIPNGVRFGFTDVIHGTLNVAKPSFATIAEIAGYHNAGGNRGNNPPQRLILAPPDQTTIRGMGIDMKNAIKDVAGYTV